MADKDSVEISTVAEFLQWVDDRCKRGERAMLYRGLADKDWEVEAGSYRRLRESITSRNPQGIVYQTLFAEDNKKIVAESAYGGIPYGQ